MKMKILINTIDKTTDFVNTIESLPGSFQLSDGIRNIEASSILGIFSMDITKPLELIVKNAPKDAAPHIKKELGHLLYKGES